MSWIAAELLLRRRRVARCCFILTSPRSGSGNTRPYCWDNKTLARFGLFDQLNTAVDGEHFHLLSGCLPGSSNTRTQTKKPHLHMYIYRRLQVAGILSSLRISTFFFPVSGRIWQTIKRMTFTFNTFVCCVFMKSKINIRFRCFQHCADSDAL